MRDLFSQQRSSGVTDPRRRRVLIGLGTGLAIAGGVGMGQVAAESHDVTVTMNNDGVSAWEVTGVDGDEDVAPTNEDNPTLTLQVGTRYLFENNGWDFHPLAFRDANDDPLLSQSGDGSFDEDPDVNWDDDGDTAAFTLTQSLADELDNYICTNHSAMNGSVETEQPPAAAVTFNDQSSDGTSVTVDSVRMDDGGFVTMHDESLINGDGDALTSVVGVSEYLTPGSHEDVTVNLDEELAETQTLIAMPHRDTNDNEEYDFVNTDGNEDGPYTDDGAITDSGEVSVAAVTFSDQTRDGTTVTVDSVRMGEGGFVTMHDDTLQDGEAVGSVVGTSGYLEPGSYENVVVNLDDNPIEETQTLIAMPHRDTNDDETYDFTDPDVDEDGPYTDDEGPITDSAEVTVAEEAAAVTFTEQTTDGTTVTVDSVRMDEGGFITMHDGETGAVVDFSEYLGPGSYENVVVSLDDNPIEETQTLIAMPHRDTNDDETYDFTNPDVDEDGPYTDDEGAITDSAEVTIAEEAAAVTFIEQTRDGTTVTIDSVRMDEGGFVTMHDSSLLDGEVVASVVGFSEYLAPGSYENVIVGLDEPLEETQTLIAMPHRDTNDDETYDFTNPDVDEDGPYTDDEGPITDSAEVTVAEEAAAVTFTEQTTDGTTVTIDSVRMDEGGFITMHDGETGAVVDFSEYLAPGSYENVVVDLDEQLTETQTLIAMPHRDTNDDETYDFTNPDVDEDGPYTDDEGAITDSAEVTIDTGSDDDVDASAPGFGMATGLAGLGGLAAYAYKKLNLDAEPPTPEEDGLDDDENQ